MACCPDTCSLCGTQKPSIGYENHDGTLGEQLAYGWEDSALSGGVNFAFLVSPSFLPAFDEQVPFKAMPGCSGGYEMILDLALCNAAKAVLRPTFTGVNDGGFGGEWSNGCFFNGNAVYFHAVGADHSGYDGYGGFSATHQTLCVLKTGTPSLYTSSTGAYNWVDITGAGTKIDNSEFTSGSYDGKLTHTSGHLS